MDGGNYMQVPTILLKVKWLKEFGFKCSKYVEVVVEGNKITLTKTNPPEIKRGNKESLEKKIENLTKKQREKLSKSFDDLDK